MEDSLKGAWITATIITVFIMAILNFVVLFPQEQGYTITDKDNQSYLVAQNVSTYSPQESLDLSKDATDAGFNDWNIEVGFMGSNTQKSSKQNLASYVGDIFSNIKLLTNELFSTKDGGTHPVIIVIGIFATLAGVYITYLVIKFIRTGN